MFKFTTAAMLASAFIVSATGCDVEKTREGVLPTVDVDVSGDAGQLPAYDVDAPDVDVSTEEKTVLVPKVIMEKETVTVPEIDVTLPKDE